MDWGFCEEQKASAEMKRSKKCFTTIVAAVMCLVTAGCGSAKEEKAQVQVFVAASLKNVMSELELAYEMENPGVDIVLSADSSGTLMTQIQEGYECDIFFSAAQKQMNTLEEGGFLVEETRHNVVNNQVVVVKGKGVEITVTGLVNIAEAENIALAAGSVPVGKYTRQAMVNLKMLPEVEDVSAISTSEIMEALDTEVSEHGNVSKVLIAVAEGACEVGTTYYSDTYGYEDKVEILEFVDYELTGDVIYPVARVNNEEASHAQTEYAEGFLEYILSEEAKAVFAKYYFDTNVE
ncbi:MAG: molybdate ABC transporter substrate-binding protein [Lachnospiraceae bacterium]|nr:molybdate ABC transporter substrate-binding protein [Lachnospiraceae bacterium]